MKNLNVFHSVKSQEGDKSKIATSEPRRGGIMAGISPICSFWCTSIFISLSVKCRL